MTLAEFKKLVFAYCKPEGQPYTTDAGEVLAEIDRQLAIATKRLLCLYANTIVFTPVQDQSTYDFTTPSAAFTIGSGESAAEVALAEIESVIYNGQVLLNMHGCPGIVSLDDLQAAYGVYQTVDPGVPRRAAVMPPGSLVLFPAPASTDGTHLISGWYCHPSILEYLATDSISVPAEYVNLVAEFCSFALREPFAKGSARQELDAARLRVDSTMMAIRTAKVSDIFKVNKRLNPLFFGVRF